MKIRKSLVAAATALTVVTAGVSAPAFAEETNTLAPAASASLSSADTPEDGAQEDDAEATDASSDPDDIKNWIGVFTAVISALGALFAFVTKYIIK
ncbi:hypothetical protein QP027_06085 [Corynebacterium breve]|uniref:Secreted protein n=1 Tax=Corynebacterium breve TaxID=3049799 RepID=A0ABY8VL43_9CORY|nr:hypothetical protein [Corynebacterium breve]WIM68943.1 hypothetical protein QP027_06085 [Corynebacterium breve]